MATNMVALANITDQGAAMKQSVDYIDSLTPLRGLAAVWVMIFHIDVSLFYRDMGALISRDASGIVSHGYLWVDFFFILSGFIMAHVFGAALSGPDKAGRIADYLWARLARIYPLHLFCLGLVVIIALVYPQIVPNVEDGSWRTFMAWKAIPSNLLLTHAMKQHVYLSWNIVSWSIGAEWWTYVITVPVIVLLHKGSAKERAWLSGLVGVMAFAGLVALVMALPDRNLDITYNYGFVRCLCEFVIGLSVYQAYRAGVAPWVASDLVVLILLVAIAAIFHFKAQDLLVVPLFAALILAAAGNRGVFHGLMKAAPWQYLGRISYSLYLVHGVVFSACWFLMPWFTAHFGIVALSLTEKLAYAASFAGGTLAMASITYHYVERPSRLWLLNLRKTAAGGAHI